MLLDHHNRLRRVEFRPVSYDVSELVDLLEYAECNMIVMSATIGTGHALFPSEIMPHHPEMDPGYVPRLIDACHERDIAVTSWVVFNIQHVRDPGDYAPAKRWPEYAMEFLPAFDGTVYPETVGMCLLGSPYWEILADFQCEVLELGVDGLWFDGFSLRGMPGQFRPGCICEWCRECFGEQTGLELPEREDWEDERFIQWLEWRAEALLANLGRIVDRVREERPDVPITVNPANHPWDAPGWKQEWEWGAPIRKFEDVYASHHSGTYDFNGPNLLTVNAKLAKAHSEAGADVWTPLWTGRELRYGEPRQQMLTYHGLGAITEGVWPWWGMAHGSDLSLAEEQPRYRWRPLKEANREIKLREHYFGGEELRFAGVVVSEHTRDFYNRSRDGSRDYECYSATLFGTHAMLAERQILHSVLYEQHLEEDDLAEYQVIILPNAAHLSAPACDRLREFVEAGGLLVASFESTLFEPHGQRREDFALADVLGVSWRDTIGKNGNGMDVRRGLLMTDPELTGGIANISIGAAHCLVEAQEGTQVLATSAGYGGHEEGLPGVTLHAFGDGEAVYFAEDIGTGYWSRPYLWTRDLFAGLVLRRRPPLEVDGPSVLYMNALRAADHLRVHLLNLPFATNRMMNRNAMATIEEVLPVFGVEVVVRDSSFSHARTIIAEEELETARRSDGSLSVTVPRVDDHEIVIVS
ncbi:MAG: beta-galactosidase trimerization domain-containing protein [Armatimonadota bacterium]|nr:beta-galactosidase trimerization domain-containing protein [Armatimonadota bacterium]